MNRSQKNLIFQSKQEIIPPLVAPCIFSFAFCSWSWSLLNVSLLALYCYVYKLPVLKWVQLEKRVQAPFYHQRSMNASLSTTYAHGAFSVAWHVAGQVSFETLSTLYPIKRLERHVECGVRLSQRGEANFTPTASTLFIHTFTDSCESHNFQSQALSVCSKVHQQTSQPCMRIREYLQHLHCFFL